MTEPVIPSRGPALLRGAGAALLAGLAAWTWIVADQVRMGAAPFAVWNGLVALGTLALAGLLWTGNPRAAAALPVPCYYIAGFSAFWALRSHAAWPWLGAAGPVAALILAQAARPRPRPPAPAPEAPKTPAAGPWLRENVESVVIAFIMALVIRCFCIEVFKIPSSSMEPTLMGDAKDGSGRSGDRIMVTKYYYAVSDIERFDVVVFKFPLNQPKNFIKRVVGLPGEELMVCDGDIYFRRPGERDFHIARKSPRVQDSLWIDPLQWGGTYPALRNASAFERCWEAAPVEGRGPAAWRVERSELITLERDGQRDVRFSFKESLDDGAGGRVNDLRLAFDFEITGPRGHVFAEIRNRHGRFEARFPTDDPATLSCPGPEGRIDRVLPGLRIRMDRLYRAELSVFDGTARVRVDGETLAEVPFLETWPPPAGRESFPAGLAFGARGLTFRARNLAVGRDLCYRGRDRFPEEQPIPTQDGYLMMGDNVASSHDSRAWMRHAYRVRGRAEPIECEGQETTDGQLGRDFVRELVEKHRLPSWPDVAIRADQNGNAWALYEKAPGGAPLPAGAPVGILEERLPPQPLRGVHRRYIVGKGLWVWWPPARSCRLIR